jgi:hypothetical protein
MSRTIQRHLIQTAEFDTSSTSDVTLVALTAVKKIEVVGMFVCPHGDVVTTYYSGPSNESDPKLVRKEVDGGGFIWLPLDGQEPLIVTAAGKALVLKLGSAVRVSGKLWYMLQD